MLQFNIEDVKISVKKTAGFYPFKRSITFLWSSHQGYSGKNLIKTFDGEKRENPDAKLVHISKLIPR